MDSLELILIRIFSLQIYTLNMTTSGEELTRKGEFKHQYSGVQLCEMAVDDRKSNSYHIKDITFNMIFVIKGKISISGDKKEDNYIQIGDNQHNLYAMSGTTIRVAIENPEDEIICINLSADFLNRYLPVEHPAYLQLMMASSNHNLFSLSTLNMPISPEMHGILQRIGNPGPRGFCEQLMLESKAVELLAHQIAHFEQIDERSEISFLKKEELERMQKVRDIIINQSGAQISLRTLAHMVGTNEFNLKRNFKLAFGNTVYGYLNQYKMEKAKSLLTDENLSIADVSQRIGYKHPTHFTSAFKKYFGYLPTRIKGGKLFMLVFLEDFLMLFEEICLAFV